MMRAETSKLAEKAPDDRGKVWASDRMLLGAGVLLSQALHEIMSRSFTQHPVNLVWCFQAPLIR